jgi:tetratricopeptide (TPR) repeat protein
VLTSIALMGGAAGLQGWREERYPPASDQEPSLYVTSGTTARRLALGYSALAADLYWIRAIQYYGDMKLAASRGAADAPAGPDGRPAAYPLLYPLLDLTTTLDPRFNIAYRFGAIFLAEPYPGGAGRPDLAIALLEKGLRDRPDKWEYMQDIGFVHYWWQHDYPAAAAAFEKASQIPDAPWFLRSLAATTVAEGGDRRSSRTMWEAIRASAEIDWLKMDAERRLMQLDASDFIESVQERVDRFTATAGTPPDNWETLVRAGALPGIPTDPTGTPYEISRYGRVGLASKSPLFPLPQEPQRLQRLGS